MHQLTQASQWLLQLIRQEEQSRETQSKKARWMMMPARPMMLEKPLNPRLVWMEKGSLAVSPFAKSKFDDVGKLIFMWHWYDIYGRFLRMNMHSILTNPSEQKSNTDQEETHMR